MKAPSQAPALALDVEAVQRTPYAYEGFDQKARGWLVTVPMNAHTHLRDPETQFDVFALAVKETAALYDLATAMPNLGDNRIRTPTQALAYQNRCRTEGRKTNPRFDVTVPLYLEPDTDPQVVEAGFKPGAWKTAKLYPKAGTTGSAEGVDFRKIHELLPVLKVMEELGMILLVHGEMVLDGRDELIPDRKREPLAVRVIDWILGACPRLSIVFEHISSRAAIDALERWKREGYRVQATIAPQYLLWTCASLFSGGMNPLRYSIPILKDPEDRDALIAFLAGGGGMLGTDSAPHVVESKSRPMGCPGGVFNEPVGLFVYFHLLRLHGGADWFEKFKNFSAVTNRTFYGEAIPKERIVIRESLWNVPERYERRAAKLIPMFAGMQMPYSCEHLAA